MDHLRGESLTRIHDREGWEVDSSNQKNPAHITSCRVLVRLLHVHHAAFTSVDQQRSIRHKFQFSYNANLPKIQILFNCPKIQVLTYKIPLEGSLNLQPKNSASCMEIHMKPNHESLHHRNQEGKTEATMIPVTSSGARSIG